ncbi:MAG: hypothetical protein KatS3mg042_0411 [Rhodothermaceae bacterium]|nr:MAG: hypothetical protein KatS3mg042_0411 [Rhodothermaceae bacterium]
MRIGWIILLLLVGPGRVAAQEERPAPTESLYIELLGNMGSFSLNFDVAFPRGFGFRLGFLAADELKFNETLGMHYADQKGFSFLIMLNALQGRGRHRLETGLGVVAGAWAPPATPPDRRYPVLTATVGYRYQPPKQGLVLRAGFTPTWDGARVHPRFGVSIGYAPGRLFR